MQEAVPVGTGAMAALIGRPSTRPARSAKKRRRARSLSVANINAPGQIVIAGHDEAVERAIDVAKKRGVRRALPLPVSAPFHCALMKPAEERLRPILESAPFKELWVSLISNVDASPIGTDHAVRNALIRQVASPVRWVESVQTDDRAWACGSSSRSARATCSTGLDQADRRVGRARSTCRTSRRSRRWAGHRANAGRNAE